MSTPGPFGFGSFDPNDLTRLLGGGDGPVSWELARMMARQGVGSEPNVDPLQRIRLDELLRVADLHVADITGLSTAQAGRPLAAEVVSPVQWADRTLDAYRPFIERLATAVAPPEGQDVPVELPPGAEALGPLFAMLPKAMGPMQMGLHAGMAVAQLSQRAFGAYDLPIPRPPTDSLLFVPGAMERFASDWSLTFDDVALWLCIGQVAHHALFAVPHVRQAVTDLLLQHAGAFRADSASFGERLAEVDPSDPASLQRLLGDPESFLGAEPDADQPAVRARLDALVAVLVGYVDHVLEGVGRRLVPAATSVVEAMRRRRAEEAPADAYVERVFGLQLDDRLHDRGRAFVVGVLERADEAALTRLWTEPTALPTPAEVDAPGLWLARIDL